MIKIGDCGFITSSFSLKDCPNLEYPEVVFLGRSNVGKSTIINSILCKNNLAKSSSKPGKTQLINFFYANFLKKDGELKQIYHLTFVDLPGFGYAKVSKSLKDSWNKNIGCYLENRSNIKIFIHLIDSRQFDMQIDDEIKDYLNLIKKPHQSILNIYTKSDKINQRQKSMVLKKDSNAIFSSSKNFKNIDYIREIIFKKLFSGLIFDNIIV